MKIKILIPIYNDWQSASKLVDEINNLSISPEFQISIIIVNDASNHDRLNEDRNLENIHSFKIINMKKNEGHARCIATGLKYIYDKEDFDYEIGESITIKNGEKMLLLTYGTILGNVIKAAELLDNDENGFVDDPALKSALQSSDALIPIFSQENSSAENQFFTQYNGEGAAAVLYNNEMDPNQTGYWGSDATVEEVIHVINAVGHTSIYPNAFSIEPNSSLMSEAMDIARGGQFITVPNQYPSSAWYHYDDQTCDYGCMAIEYMYWSIVSWMGILDDPSTCNGIDLADGSRDCLPT